ncbi:MAG: DUF3500 domain-containing protein [Opitutus sp.]|nr:DUF3500 domain-containing protein [Opitutus sp.]
MRPTSRRVGGLLALFLVALVARAAEPAADMLKAAQAFLSTLSPEQTAKAVFPFAHAERENWIFVPHAREGLSLKVMSEPQRELALTLLRSALSQRGTMRTESIRALENVLREIEGPKGTNVRDSGLYYFTIFGSPGAQATWGWRYEGHHCSLNFTLVDGRLTAVTPSFMGDNPAEVKTGPMAGKRTLPEEEDLGRALIKALDDRQRGVAIFAEKSPNDIVTGNSKRANPLAPAGLAVAQMTPAQSEQCLGLLKLYLDRYRAEIGTDALAKIRAAGWEKVHFAWAGGLEKGQGHYYRIQGPTFLVEYDNTQNNANHIHTAWRDFSGDFGRDVLAEHLARDHAKP